MKLAFVFKAAADEYTTDYPATVGPHMTNTDSTPFTGDDGYTFAFAARTESIKTSIAASPLP